MYELRAPITAVNGFRITAGFFSEFATLTDEGARQELLEAWAACITPATGEECGRCHGRGYTRKDQNVGCHVCHGTGRVGV